MGTVKMAFSPAKILLNMTLVLLIALVVSSCGRRGALEAPESATVVSVDENGEERVEQVKEDKPFILDPLL